MKRRQMIAQPTRYVQTSLLDSSSAQMCIYKYAFRNSSTPYNWDKTIIFGFFEILDLAIFVKNKIGRGEDRTRI